MKELLQMAYRNLNRGLKPTGRIMLLVMLAIFFALFLITGVTFARIAHTGMVGEENLLVWMLNRQLGRGDIQARRGTIFDRHGGTIASQHPSHTLVANFEPDWGSYVALKDVAYTAGRLAEIINMDRYEIIEILGRREIILQNEDGEDVVHIISQAEFGSAGRRLSFIERDAINALELPGIFFRDDLTRFYPHGAFASHTIGYTFFNDEGGIVGGMGIEGFFNEELTATYGEYQFLQDRFFILQPGAQRYYLIEPLDGYDIYLTLDMTIQGFLESAMDEMLQKIHLEYIVAVIMDATTGEILAAGSRPTFDPNDRNPEFYANRIIYPFDPGSTFKIFTYAAAINEGNYHGSHTFMSGPRWIGGTRLGDHGAIEQRIRTFDKGFYVSTNSSVIDLLQNAITPNRFIEYLAEFGFGRKTNLPLNGEAAGELPRTSNPIYAFTASFGQGVRVTPIQLLQATSAILNDGQMVRPQLISRIYDPNTNQNVYQFEREVVGNPITAEAARQMQELMRGVVHSEIGTGRIHYRLDVVSGGKTGTAQIPCGLTGGHLQGEYIYNYIGFAPADDPEVIMFIAVRKNQEVSERSGHYYAGQIYRFVMNNTLNYLGLSGNLVRNDDITNLEIERVEVPRVFNLLRDEAIAKAEEVGLTPIVIGNGRDVFNQLPVDGFRTFSGDKLFIQTDTEDRLPNFTGWTRAEITQYERLLGLEITIIGQGVGASQSLRPNSVVQAGDSLTVTLE